MLYLWVTLILTCYIMNPIQTREFLDKIYFGSSTPHITIPTRITPCSRTLIDNIFMNTVDEWQSDVSQ